MADPEHNPPKSSNLPVGPKTPRLQRKKAQYPEMYRPNGRRWKPIQIRVAQLLGQGWTPRQIAIKYAEHIMPNSQKIGHKLVLAATHRIAQWRQLEEYRDLVYEWSLVDLEKDIPGIFQGVVSKAKAGRVDAARLVLEVTGRHAPQTEVTPAVVQINLNSVPRPQEDDVVDGEAEELEA